MQVRSALVAPQAADQQTADPQTAEAEAVGFTLNRSLGIVVVLIGFVVGAAALADNSLLTHLATGELILNRGSVPSTDPYSVTAAGQPWTVQSWLVSLIYALADRAVGLPAVRLIHGVVAAAVAGGLWQLTAPVRSVLPRLALTIFPILLGVGFWSPRPLMFGLAAMVALLHIVQLERSPVLVVPLMWLWANSHGSYPLAFVLLGAVAFGTWLDSGASAREAIDAVRAWRRDRSPEGRHRSSDSSGPPGLPVRELRIIGLALVGTVGAVVGPLGFRVLTFPFQLLGRRESLEGVLEWQAPSFTSSWELLTLGLIPLVIVAVKRGAGWRTIGPSLAFLCSALLATRNIAVAAVVVVAMVAPSFESTFGTIDGSAVTVLSRTLGRAAAAGVIVAVVAVMISPALELKWYPVDEVDFLEERGLAPTGDSGLMLIHREAVGNYLGYRYGERASVFIDDRFDFHPYEVITDHLTLLDGGDHREVLDRRGAQVIIWQAEEQLSLWLTDADEWRIAMRSEDWIVACRLDGPAADRCFG